MPRMVLVVDDNEFIRRAVCRIFTSEWDFDVCGQAKNGLEAIEKAQALRPDLIVMDLSMPVMNGLDAAAALKDLMPHSKIILFSEYGDVFSDTEARSAGVSDQVSKFEHISVLLQHARRLCGEMAA